MEQQVLDLLSQNKALTINEISKSLKINDFELTKKLLEKMLNNLELSLTKKNKYTLFNNEKYIKGTISLTKGGYGFVGDVFIPKKFLKGAIHGDIVAIELVNTNNDKKSGKVVQVKTRGNKVKVGEIINKGNKCHLKLDDPKFTYKVVLENVNLVDGMKVSVILGEMINETTYKGKIEQVLGHKDDPGIDLLSITKEYGIQKEFPSKVLEEVKNIPSEITQKDIEDILKKGGKDLRDEIIFTIDGDDTKDIDDALSIKILPNYNYEVGVHIANVSHYVQPNTELFKNATERGTSVYIPGSSIPMLPRELSNGICSLNPNVDRLALSFIMEIDKNGNVVNFKVHESIINSKIQMTYKNVNKILDENITPEGYEDFVSHLKLLNKVALILRKKRILNGSIDFDMNENKIVVDEKGHPIDVVLRTRGAGERLIEDFMVETGEQSSIFLDQFKDITKHIYRNHDEPNEAKIETFIAYLGSIGHKKLIECVKELNPREIQKILESLKDTKEYEILKRELLKCMSKAIYSSNEGGHFALGLKSYCQTTSPIRRAGDLVNHCLIKQNIYSGQKIKLHSDLSELANQASSTERNAEACEKDAVKMKAAEYMEDHIGEEFTGTITSLTRFGMYVELPNLIEGLIKIDSLLDDNYEFDQQKFIYKGRSKGKIYRLGDTINVRVSAASKKDRTIDFEIVGQENNKVKKVGKFQR